MMASHLINIPTINGYSGYNPRNCNHWDPKAKDIKNSVKEWESSMNIEGNICKIYKKLSVDMKINNKGKRPKY